MAHHGSYHTTRMRCRIMLPAAGWEHEALAPPQPQSQPPQESRRTVVNAAAPRSPPRQELLPSGPKAPPPPSPPPMIRLSCPPLRHCPPPPRAERGPRLPKAGASAPMMEREPLLMTRAPARDEEQGRPWRPWRAAFTSRVDIRRILFAATCQLPRLFLVHHQGSFTS